jgi:hypothetical protein
LKRDFQFISINIDPLYGLSNTKRKISGMTQDTTAGRSFKILYEDGTNVEPFLKETFARYLLDKFPGNQWRQ